jgi:hypothetical protein
LDSAKLTHDPWFWAFIASLVFGIGFSLLRESHYVSISRKYSEILRIMRGACKQIADLKQLHLDIEQRTKLDRIEAQLRAGSHGGTHIDISGGRVNQVGGKIENE